jgi:hypothetical protein
VVGDDQFEMRRQRRQKFIGPIAAGHPVQQQQRWTFSHAALRQPATIYNDGLNIHHIAPTELD